jgi:protein phosphatase 1G
MQGWRRRMEDAHIAEIDLGTTNSIHLFGVFDGHGGREVAEFVKQHFTKELISNKYFTENLEKSLSETFLKMDILLSSKEGKEELRNQVIRNKDDEEQRFGHEKNRQVELFKGLFDPRYLEDCEIAFFTGCTACVVAITPVSVYFANAGDSRAIICSNGKAVEITNDHKPELETEKERIYKADGWISEGRVKGNLNLTRSIGDLEYKQNKKLTAEQQMITACPEIRNINLSEVEFIVIACDGVWDCKSSQEVVEYIAIRLSKDIKLSSIIEELFNEILATDVYNSKIFLNNI